MKRMLSYAVAVILALTGPVWASTIVFEQPPVEPTISTRASSFTSPNNAFNFQTFDNFTLADTQLLTDVHWRGSYFNADPGYDHNNPAPANATGFKVGFYASTNELPGALLAEYTFSLAQVNETAVTTELFGVLNTSVFDYDVLFDTPFEAVGGTEYWISIYALQPTPSLTEAQWGWLGAFEGTSIQDTHGGEISRGVVQRNRAFALTTTTVPEPATLLLVGAGLIGVGVASRHRRGR